MTSPAPSAQTRLGSLAARLEPYRWLGGVWLVVVVFGLVTAWRSHQVGIGLRDPDGRIFWDRFTLSITLLIVFGLLDAAVRGWHGRPRTWANLSAAARERWTPARMTVAVTGLVAYHVVYSFYRNLKSWNAFREQHDESLLRFDRWLFNDNSPAVLVHNLFGEHVAAHVFEVIYESFSTLVPISFVAALVLAPKMREGYLFLTAAMWVWILGVASYYIIPAIGPFDSAPQDFAGLSRTSITSTQESFVAARDFFLAHPEQGHAFASIGAFASLHTGFTCMIWLMTRVYGLKTLSRVLGVYLVAVMISTVYLGWHFVSDVAAGVLVAVLSVALAKLTVYPRGRRTT